MTRMIRIIRRIIIIIMIIIIITTIVTLIIIVVMLMIMLMLIKMMIKNSHINNNNNFHIHYCQDRMNRPILFHHFFFIFLNFLNFFYTNKFTFHQLYKSNASSFHYFLRIWKSYQSSVHTNVTYVFAVARRLQLVKRLLMSETGYAKFLGEMKKE